MLSLLTNDWRTPLIRGAVMVLFGTVVLALFSQPRAALVIALGIYLLVDGAVLGVSGLRFRERFADWWLLVLQGGIGVGVALGVALDLHGTATVPGLVVCVSSWSLAVGVLDVVAANRLDGDLAGRHGFLVAGLARMLLACLLMWHPGIGALALWWIISLGTIVFGLALIAAGFGLKRQIWLGSMLTQLRVC